MFQEKQKMSNGVNEKHQFIIPAVIFAVVVSIVGGFLAVRAQTTGWIRPQVQGDPALYTDGNAQIGDVVNGTGGALQTRGGAILNTGGAPTGLIVASGNVGIGTLAPDSAYKLDVAGFFQVKPPSAPQPTYNYTTQSTGLTQLPWFYEPGRCSWSPDDTIWETPPSPNNVSSSDYYCYDINKTVIDVLLPTTGCSVNSTSVSVQCPCDTGSSSECKSALGINCGQREEDIQIPSPLTEDYCFDRMTTVGTYYDIYTLMVNMRYYRYDPGTTWGKVNIGSASQGNTLCLNGDCRASWPASSSGGSGTVTSVGTGNGLTGGPITTSGTISINSPACTTSQKLLWNGSAFVCDTDQTSGGGDGLGSGNSGNAGYITKWTTSTSIGNSIIQDNGTNAGIGSIGAGYRFNAEGAGGVGGLRGASTGGGNGVTGTTDSGTGVLGSSGTGYAGYFSGKVMITGSLEVACPLGFISVNKNNNTNQFGCIQSSENGTASWWTAAQTCFDSYGGKLPSMNEWYTAINNLSLANELDDWEWVDGSTGNSSGRIIGNGSFTAIAGAGYDTIYAYRCWLPR